MANLNGCGGIFRWAVTALLSALTCSIYFVALAYANHSGWPIGLAGTRLVMCWALPFALVVGIFHARHGLEITISKLICLGALCVAVFPASVTVTFLSVCFFVPREC
jgi:hypothetical protein